VAGGIAAVMSQDLAPYREALAGFCERTGRQVTVFQLKNPSTAEPEILRRLRSERPDLVVALGIRAAVAVEENLPGVPMVFGMTPVMPPSPPTGSRWTGVLLVVPPDLQMAAFRETVPTLSRLGVLYDPRNSAAFIERARSAAAASGIELITGEVSRPEDLPSAYRRTAARSEGFWVIPDGTVVSRLSFDFILKESLRRMIPVMVFDDSMVRAGGLMSLAPDSREVGRQIADLALRLLQPAAGTAPPVEPPRAPRLVLNLNVAHALGIEIPPEAVARASQVYR